MPIKSVRHDGVMCVLVDQQSGVPVEINDTYGRDGVEYSIIGGRAPHSPASTGRVTVRSAEQSRELYPSVFDLSWIPENEV